MGSGSRPVAFGAVSEPSDEEVRDELPSDLVAAGYVGPYKFPDNSRRRIPGVLYLVSAAVCLAIYFAAGDDAGRWGSYYDHEPVVLAGHLPRAMAQLARRKAGLAGRV